MDWNIRKLTCQQLMRQLDPFDKFSQPTLGWVKTIRKAIGMTTIQLAKRCGLSKQRILRIEQDEILGRTTLATLEKVAQQLECKLVYAFFPQKDLLQMIEDQAEQKALEKLVGISHSMKLENQKIAETIQKEQLELLKEKLIRENIKSLWQ